MGFRSPSMAVEFAFGKSTSSITPGSGRLWRPCSGFYGLVSLFMTCKAKPINDQDDPKEAF